MMFAPLVQVSPMSSSHLEAGSWPVMLTPFAEDGSIDWPALDALIDWYVAGGSQGLFAACLSSEIFHLSEDERLSIARHTVERVGGRVPVIAAGALPSGISLRSAVSAPEALAESIAKVAATGVRSVILLTNQFAYAHEGADVWQACVEDLLERIDPQISLGLYECPVPYKRVLTSSMTEWAARTGRFHFLKDTCCDLALIQAKLAAVSGTPLRFYNAHTATLLASLQAGGHGFSGVGANAIPHLYAWLCRHFDEEPEVARELQAFLVESSPAVDVGYPFSVKTYLGIHGVPMTSLARLGASTITAAEINALALFHRKVEVWEQRLCLSSPFAHAAIPASSPRSIP
ncbi:dihydrodipicolinate synthase family protein [Spartobacteria bacterium LR76]|nr:dihydrodipicolinate synthase family protein [Spartobacteria bacterium LR76]